jgi:hypothetical protein
MTELGECVHKMGLIICPVMLYVMMLPLAALVTKIND